MLCIPSRFTTHHDCSCGIISSEACCDGSSCVFENGAEFADGAGDLLEVVEDERGVHGLRFGVRLKGVVARAHAPLEDARARWLDHFFLLLVRARVRLLEDLLFVRRRLLIALGRRVALVGQGAVLLVRVEPRLVLLEAPQLRLAKEADQEPVERPQRDVRIERRHHEELAGLHKVDRGDASPVRAPKPDLDERLGNGKFLREVELRHVEDAHVPVAIADEQERVVLVRKDGADGVPAVRPALRVAQHVLPSGAGAPQA
mmetsp:Transcript_13415/g.44194  ORF Transcript_13415/g.44194 Transcript_13415/m.44194 type:complete len:259 (-) Transcript_13415:2057-2833(-)